MGMGETRNHAPAGESFVNIEVGRRGELKRSFLGRSSTGFGKKYFAVAGAAKPLAKRVLSVHDAAFPGFTQGWTIHAELVTVFYASSHRTRRVVFYGRERWFG
jgi:hypothetical protein